MLFDVFAAISDAFAFAAQRAHIVHFEADVPPSRWRNAECECSAHLRDGAGDVCAQVLRDFIWRGVVQMPRCRAAR